MRRALLIYPTHKNCHEVEADYRAHGIKAASYPGRVTPPSPEANCWNPAADDAEKLGLSVLKTVCPSCNSKSDCQKAGYLHQLIELQKADVAVCTQKRAELTGLAELIKGRDYCSIHENPVNLLRPRCDVSLADLQKAQLVLHRVLNDPVYLDWFGEASRINEEGERQTNQELAILRERLYQFVRHLLGLVDELLQTIPTVQHLRLWTPPSTSSLPRGIERLLFRATRDCGTMSEGQLWRFLLLAAAGQLQSSLILASRPGEAAPIEHLVIGYRSNLPPRSVVTWFNDATITHERLQALLGDTVRDGTPRGTLTLKKRAVQIPQDIKRRTSPNVVVGQVRGVLADYPAAERLGIICHRTHVSRLQEAFEKRISKMTYFGSGDDRSSNEWHTQCDLILVLGTPRVSLGVVAAYLAQVGETEEASHPSEWKTLCWEGVTETGKTRLVYSKGYADEAWRRAHQDIVRAALIQAIGRGRGLLENGCDVIVLSNEECGLRICEKVPQPIGATDISVLKALHRLSPEIPNNSLLGKTGVSTARIARRVDLSESHVREVLAGLAQRRMVQKVGERGGWLLTSFGRNVLAGREHRTECRPDRPIAKRKRE